MQIDTVAIQPDADAGAGIISRSSTTAPTGTTGTLSLAPEPRLDVVIVVQAEPASVPPTTQSFNYQPAPNAASAPPPAATTTPSP